MVALLETGGSGDFDAEMDAAAELRHLGMLNGGMAVLIAGLDDDDMEVRGMAAMALGQIGESARPALPALMQMVSNESSSDAKEEAVEALGRIDKSGEVTVSLLIELLGNSDDDFLRRASAYALGEIGESAAAAVPALMAALSDSSYVVSRDALQSLAKIGTAAKAAIPEAVVLLDDSDSLQRAHAAQALGVWGKTADAAVPKLREAVQDPEGSMRVLAAYALIRIDGTDEAQTVLVEELANDDVFVRFSAAAALCDVGDPAEAVPALIDALDDEWEPMGFMAACCIALLIKDDTNANIDRTDLDRVITVLVHGLDEESLEFRLMAAMALEELGERASTAVARLTACLDDDRFIVREAASKALRQIKEGEKDDHVPAR